MSSNFSGNPNEFLQQNYIIPENEEEKDMMMRRYLNDIASAVNTRESGLYNSVTTVTGQQFLPTFGTSKSSNATYRSVLRKVINFGALPNATTKNVAHGITFSSSFSVTRLYGAATQPNTRWIPIPFASPTLNQNISLSMDATNIIITTGIDRTAYTRSFVVVEWIQTT